MAAIKRTIGILFVAAVLLACLPASAQGKPDDIIIGEVAAVTGPAATVGVRLHQSAQMWTDDINKQGGINGRKIQLITCNDEAEPEKAAACARDLIAKGSTILLLHTFTGSILAVEPLVANGPITICASPNVTPSPNSYVFQASPSDLYLSQALVDFLKTNHINRIGVIAATDASGEVTVENAKKVFPASGIDLKLARIDLKATDASIQLAMVASKDVKIVYSAYSGAGAATVVKSYSNLGLQQPLVVSYANVSPAFVSVVKDMLPPRLLGVTISSVVPELIKDPQARQRSFAFAKAFQARYGNAPDNNNFIAKMDMDITEAVLRKVKNPKDVKAVKAFLESTPIPSVLNLRFSPTNHIALTKADVAIVELKNGVWTKADPVK